MGPHRDLESWGKARDWRADPDWATAAVFAGYLGMTRPYGTDWKGQWVLEDSGENFSSTVAVAGWLVVFSSAICIATVGKAGPLAEVGVTGSGLG